MDPQPAYLVLAEALGLAVNSGCILVVLAAALGRLGLTWTAWTAGVPEKVARLEELAVAKLMDIRLSLLIQVRILASYDFFQRSRQRLIKHTRIWCTTAQLRDLLQPFCTSCLDLGLSLLPSDPCLSLRCRLFTCVSHTERLSILAVRRSQTDFVTVPWCFGGY